MVHPKKRTPAVAEVHADVAGLATNLLEKRYGRHGPPGGTPLTPSEDLRLERRDVRAQKRLAQSLSRPAAAQDRPPPPTRTGPTRQGPLASGDRDRRLVHSRAGDAAWSEPQGSGSRGRRAFFLG